jgi:hypothetical protein
MPITFTPGTEAPLTGTYAAVDADEQPLGRAISVRRGAPFPPILDGERGYLLVSTDADSI